MGLLNKATELLRHARPWVPVLYRYLLYGDTSLSGECRFVSRLIQTDWPRVLVDVGAFDGFTFSNSYPFLRQKPRWKGMLIEPHPANFARCQKRWQGNPDVLCIPRACHNFRGTMPFYFDSKNEKGGQSSTLCTDDEPFLQSMKSGRSIEVEVDTLTHLLDEARWPGDFSLLSTDCEGMDYEVFQGLDLQRYRPRIIVTEIYGRKEKLKHTLLQSAGYHLVQTIACNTVWVLNEYRR
jgi:FkbM family methyltransferase